MHKASVTLQLCLWTTDVLEVTKAWCYDIDRLVLPQLETVCQPLPPVLSTSASAYERQCDGVITTSEHSAADTLVRVSPRQSGRRTIETRGGTRMGVAGGKQSDQEGERDRAWLPGKRLGGGQWWHVREELGWPGVWGGGGEEGYVESLQSSSVSNSHAARADGPRASIIDRACATASSQGWRGWWCWCWWWFSGRRDGWSSGGTARDPSAQARAWRVGGTRKLVAELFQTLTAAFICCALRTRSKWGWRKLWNAASVRSIGKIHCRTLNTLAINQSRSH